MAKRHKNKGHKAHSHGRGLSKTRGSRRGRGGSTSNRGGIDPSTQYPDLMDLNSGVPEVGASTMKLGSRRPGRLADEVRYTNEHINETMKQPLRKKPIVFVKAKEVYDPSAELYKKMAQKKESQEVEEKSETVEENEDSSVEELYFVDETGDSNQQVDLTIKSEELPSNKKTVELEIIEEVVDKDSCVEHDPTFSIGKVFLNSQVSADGSLEARLPKITNYEAAQNYINQVMSSNRMYSDDDDEDDMDTSEEEFVMYASDEEDDVEEDVSIDKLSIKDKEPEYGFLEEDYQFDISCINITNVRLSVNLKQFYLRSFKVLGVDEFIWIDGEDLLEFLIDNGMSENRVEAYYKYVMNGLGVNDEVEEQPDYSDVYISETSEEEEEEEDDEGLNDLIEYASKGKIFGNHDDEYVPPTETLKTKGKGSKKQLDLELDDLALMESLQDQYISHKKSRKDKKLAKRQLQVNEYDLLAKYLYTMHIRDIKDEFEQFLHDGNRSSLTFPPMDPHGLKTLKKMADFYNMKSRKFGNGLKTHIVVIKSKRTFHSTPYYNDISRVMKQRPVFNRIDVKRSQDEIANSKDLSKSRHGIKSKAHVKEGDIVGDKAPEIGQENIGRRLLEKLGWSKGEGLGVDNRGISEPIVAKIKNTKLGIK